MIIDFHAHIFPEKIASAALQKLSSVIHLEPSHNGTAEGLLASMDKAGVDVSVILPVVTDVRQYDSVFRFAVKINEDSGYFGGSRKKTRLISLAGLHPDDPQMKEHIRQIAEAGFCGIKVHPHYQSVPFNDIRFKRMIDLASEQELLVLTHSGYDPYTPENFCSVDMIAEVLDEVKPAKLVLAHMGNCEHYDEVEAKICGRNVFFDTGYSITHMTKDQFSGIVKKHGSDRILFGTDAPWTTQKECVECLKEQKLTYYERQLIFSGNARKLLGL